MDKMGEIDNFLICKGLWREKTFLNENNRSNQSKGKQKWLITLKIFITKFGLLLATIRITFAIFLVFTVNLKV